MQWNIFLFGGLEAESPDGRREAWKGTRAGLLLACLALRPNESHSRETLAERLWPDGDPATKRVRLRQEIAALRDVFGADAPDSPLLVTRTEISFATDYADTDIRLFDLMVAAAKTASHSEREAALREAVTLYRGDLLTGYPDHFLAERAHYGHQFEQALASLAALQQSRGDNASTVETLKRLAAHDPLREDVHADIMRLYAALGQPSLARRQYGELARLLKNELGEEPSEAVRRLYRSLRNDVPYSPAETVPASGEPLTGTAEVPESFPPLPTPVSSNADTHAAPNLGSEPAKKPNEGTPFSLARLSKKGAALAFLASIALLVIPVLRTNSLKTDTPKSIPIPNPTPTAPIPLPFLQDTEEWVFHYKPRPGEKPNAEAKAILPLSDGRVVVTGLIQTEKDDADFLTVFLNPDGTVDAVDRYSSLEKECDRAFSIAGDTRYPGVYVAGETYVPGAPSVEGWYLTLVKYENSGKRVWVCRSPIRTQQNATVRVTPDGSGGVYLAGTTSDHGGAPHKILLLRYDARGHLLWKKTLTAGNGSRTTLSALMLWKDGNVVVGGTARRGETLRGVDQDWLIVRYMPNGEHAWSCLIDSGAKGDDAFGAFLPNRFETVYVGGTFDTNGGRRLGLVNLAWDNTILWRRYSQGEASFSSMARDYISGEVIFMEGYRRTSTGDSSVFLSCFGTDAQLRWEQSYPNAPGIAYVDTVAGSVLSSGDLLLAGTLQSAKSHPTEGPRSLWLGRYRPDGVQTSHRVLSWLRPDGGRHVVGGMYQTDNAAYIVGRSIHANDVRFMVVKYFMQ
jgi:DNA-binding SARP family transcriptional activator